MRFLEQVIAGTLHLFRLDRIKTRLLVFAALVTLIPAVTTGWQAYVLNRQYITEKVAEELRNAAFQAERELTLWIKEHLYDMRVFASSYEVTENLEKLIRTPTESPESDAERRLTEYLRSVKEKFAHYEELVVIGPGGRVISASGGRSEPPKLPDDWLRQAQSAPSIVGEPYWDRRWEKGVMAIGVPARAPNGRFLGVLVGELNFGRVHQILASYAVGHSSQVYLVNRDGVVIVGSRPAATPFMKVRIAPAAVENLFSTPDASFEYVNPQGIPSRGVLRPIKELNWGAVAEISRDEAYAQTERVRDVALVTVAALLVGIGLLAYLLALAIVRPLDRLTAGANRVAAGNLDVDLPAVGHGEVQQLTRVFNHMVSRLRQGREELAASNTALSERNRELQELSVTDGLTGLYNRKHLMDALATEISRAQRLKHTFAVLMLDIDHFKRYNDTHGHLAGDRLLAGIARIFRDAIRNIDYAARYGGEEFLVMLPEVGGDGAIRAAERIRERVAGERFEPEQAAVTISIGVATFPEHGETPEAVIASADAALYEAKRAGRNRVVMAGAGQPAV